MHAQQAAQHSHLMLAQLSSAEEAPEVWCQLSSGPRGGQQEGGGLADVPQPALEGLVAVVDWDGHVLLCMLCLMCLLCWLAVLPWATLLCLLLCELPG